MKRKVFSIAALVALCLLTLVAAVGTGQPQQPGFESPRLEKARSRPSPAAPPIAPQASSLLTNPTVSQSPPTSASPNQPTASKPTASKPTATPAAAQRITQVPSAPIRATDCAIQPSAKPNPGDRRPLADSPITLERFRRLQSESLKGFAAPANTAAGYRPREEIALIHASNYGDRFLLDVNGKPVNNAPIIVLHETVATAASTIGFFRTPHSRDQDQASYHTLIRQDGAIVYLVPPEKRAFGAGNSVFVGANGAEAVKTHRRFAASVNNFAYHISLETPADGMNNAPNHSGYTDMQYYSLAWLVAKTGIPESRITTHKDVDRSESRMDPRSFNTDFFIKVLQMFPRTEEIPIQCTVPAHLMQSKLSQASQPSAVLTTRPRS